MEISGGFTEVMQTFLTNGVHGECWSKTVYAVAQYTSHGKTRYFRAMNTKGFHAENAVLIHLVSLLMKKELSSPEVKLYLSYSPCHECSQRIIDLLNTARLFPGWSLKIEIVFSALYRIRRPSCVARSSCAGHLPSYDDHAAQVKGLKNLYESRNVVLRTFTVLDWVGLWIALDFPGPSFGGRKEGEDALLKQDFKQLMDLEQLRDSISFQMTMENLRVLLERCFSA